jgi:hypothetical protein
MIDDGRTGAGTATPEPGIAWVPGDEDYPFPAVEGEDALEFFGRWLERAPYARIDRDGVRYLHERDVANLLNHVTADIGLIRRRLDSFGDRVMAADEYDETIQRIEAAVGSLDVALERLRRSRG